ncbi:hypothetical protein ACM01_12900 [Streptomyces viridochromogenes]|uniref:Secreted protein n=1 Tax=Streptomyces viridochromogenes TaxID=1938 RepID=A0A0J7ZI39_STRVR|nr:hypothetical protein [Streptomyces viridochromogenes]KMS74813.1 hypothetical protein ACM01_12900 [Streptomyces viridochromogenes]KOG14872.1 hypothetical protein ADK36_30445 [Streptomyces viridochromogenes]KOG15066.1 hypothetical protein ADK35_30090 [Streptomyces viridochromogenes]
MPKRKLKNKKIRIVAAVSALMTSGAVVVALPPSANAAAEKTPEEIMRMCQRAKVLNGKQQSVHDFGGGGVGGPGFGSDSCEFVQTKPIEFYNGPKEKASIDYANCEPNSTEPTQVQLQGSAEIAQGRGKYTLIQQGFAAGIFGALNASWVQHEGTLDMTVKAAGTTLTDKDEVPVGKVLYMTFEPKMQRMTGVWRVKIEARPATTTTNAVPEQIFEAPEVVEGPVVLAGAAGAPGKATGVRGSETADC